MLRHLVFLAIWTICHVADSVESNVQLSPRVLAFSHEVQRHEREAKDGNRDGAYANASGAPVGFEEMEAMVVESSSSMLIDTIVRGTLSIGKSVRYVGDTTTSVVSGGLKSISGLLSLFSEAMKELILPLVTPCAPTDRMPDHKLRLGRKAGKIVWALASGIHVSSTILQLLGDTTESVTIGFGQSVEDSFSGLVFVMSQIKRGTNLLLHPARTSVVEEGESTPLPETSSKYQQKEDMTRPYNGTVDVDDSVKDGINLQDTHIERNDTENNNNVVEGDQGEPPSTQKTAMQTEMEMRVEDGATTASFLLATQVFMAFVAVLLIVLHPMSKVKKYIFLGVLGVALAMLLRWIERYDRERFYTQATVRSISEYLHSQVVYNNKASTTTKHEYESLLNPHTNMERFEASVWANVFTSALWKTQADFHTRNRQSIHGLGAYMSSIMFDIITEELKEIPEGLNKFTLRKFSFGSEPPFIKAIRCNSRRDSVCLNHNTDSSREWWPVSSSSCMHVVMDIDFAYASKDMDTVFTFRSDEIKSLLPEASITFSEVLLEGIFRLDAELTPTYPFLGNAAVSFLEMPKLDVSIGVGQGFSNIDVANIPGVYNFLNSTLTWMLSQYTYPKSGALDVGSTLCPSCFGEQPTTNEQAPFTVASLFGDIFKTKQ